MKTIDARGKTCPQPVMMTKQAADAGEKELAVIVDNDTARENVSKFGNKLGYNVNVENKEDGIYISLVNDEITDCEIATEEAVADSINKLKQPKKGFVIGSDKLGKGSDDLGKILMKGFLYTLSETKPYPNFLIFLNSGVKLTASGSESIDDLKKLEGAGVKIVSCGTCLDFFEIKDKLEVGSVTNMYDIVETIAESDNAVMI
ncbi:MAG TPA: sulfurtransferase-like selenium metabolism protein YedF [Clostridiales bacterium]|nr:sulfurtransferase-like selenium metabolism protein YedF [Clostridiales bacterium]